MLTIGVAPFGHTLSRLNMKDSEKVEGSGFSKNEQYRIFFDTLLRLSANRKLHVKMFHLNEKDFRVIKKLIADKVV